MFYFLKSRRSLLIIAVSVVCLVVVNLSSGVSLDIPALLGGGGSNLPVATLIPVIPVSVLAFGLSTRVRGQEAATVRPVAFYDVLVGAGPIVLGGLNAALMYATGDSSLGYWYVRNLTLLTGTLYVGLGLRSPATGSTLATLVVVLTTSYGTNLTGSRFVRVLQSGP